MRFRWTGQKFEYFRVDADWWGTIAPPDPTRFASQFQDEDKVYLDLGTSTREIRNLFIKNIWVANTGGFKTVVSGLTPTQSYHLTTKQYVDNIVSPASLSGLADVQTTGWVSGVHIGWDGSQFVPSTAGITQPSAISISGRFTQEFSESETATFTHNLSGYPQVTVLDSNFCEIDVQVCHNSIDETAISFTGTVSGWFIADKGVGGGPTTFSGLVDVQSTAWKQDHVPQYDGTTWMPFIPSLSGLVDTQGDNWSANSRVSWDGTKFVPITVSQVSGHYVEYFNEFETATFNHNLGVYPQVIIINMDLCELDVQICHTSVNETTISFNGDLEGYFIADAALVTEGGGGPSGGHKGLQFTATDTYTFNHNLGDYPQIQVTDASFGKIEVDWSHTDQNTTELSFNGTITNGWAFADLGKSNPYLVPSGDYVTPERGHKLWAASGVFVYTEQFTATDSYQFHHYLSGYPQIEVTDSGRNSLIVNSIHDSISGTTLYFNGTLTDAWVNASLGGAGFELRHYPKYNVLFNGLKGDGVTNDDVALQALIDRLPVSGATVYFPNGRYMLATTSVCRQDNVIFEGENSTELVINGDAVYAIRARGNTDPRGYIKNITFRNLTVIDEDPLNHVTASEESHGLHSQLVRNLTYENIKCYGIGDEALEVGQCQDVFFNNIYLSGCCAASAAGGALSVANSRRVLVNNYINHANVGGSCFKIEANQVGVPVDSIKLTNALFLNPSGWAISGGGGGVAIANSKHLVYGIEVENVRVIGGTGIPFTVNPTTDGSCASVHFNNCQVISGGETAKCDGVGARGAFNLAESVYRSSVTNCYVDGWGNQASQYPDGIAGNLNGIRSAWGGNNISNNQIYNVSGNGIITDGDTEEPCTIAYNTISGCGKNGILANKTDLISNNYIFNCDGYACYTANAYSGMLVTNNVFENCASGIRLRDGVVAINNIFRYIKDYAIVMTNSDSAIHIPTAINNPMYNCPSPLFMAAGTSGVIIQENVPGFKTANTGFVTFTNDGPTTISTPHGCTPIPRILDVTLTPHSTASTAGTFWVDSIDATDITLKIDTAADFTLGWTIVRRGQNDT